VYRVVGIILVLTGLGAAAGEWAGLELPSLHWFFGFTSGEESLREASWRERHQAAVIGYGSCALLVLGGAASLVRSRREFHWNPQTLRMFRRFRSLGRGYVSLLLIVVLIVLALLDHVLVGKRALLVKYEDRIYAPAISQKRYSERDFGGEALREADYRELQARFRGGEGDNWVVMPPVPFDATFDSEDELRVGLVKREGLYYREGRRKPFSGLAYRFYAGDPARRHSMVRFREGLQQGREDLYERSGDRVGIYVWKDGRRESEPRMGGEKVAAIEAAPTTPLLAVTFPPLPPDVGSRHYLGTDSRGWDVLAQLFGGLQVVLQAAVIYLAVTYAVGVTIGCLMGYFGGVFDIVTQRFIEILANVPFLYVVIIIADRIGRDNITLVTILLVICIFSWIHITYYMRTATYKEKARDYVAAARVIGAGPGRVIFRHVLPNAVSTVVTLLPFSVAAIITSLTALDFIGFGLPDTYPSWGRLLSDGVSHLDSPWIVASVFGGMVAVLLLVTFVGEAVREAVDPKKFTTYR